jgi:hypothetical protein
VADRGAQLARIAELRPAPAVRIYELDDGRGPWPYWFCNPCLAKKVDAGYAVKDAKDPPHALRCEGCGLLEGRA